MNPYEIIDKYYPENTQQRQILVILAKLGRATESTLMNMQATRLRNW